MPFSSLYSILTFSIEAKEGKAAQFPHVKYQDLLIDPSIPV
jgi:hypothetical protein